jgi:enoyl-CoA hydratase/carnithine racemase
MNCDEGPLLITARQGAGIITLNRPQALNALNMEMILELSEILKQWREDPLISCVVLQASGERAFCAGGDLRSVYEAYQLKKESKALSLIFKKEYRLNYEIHTFPKPYISFLKGYTMGGGLGLSVHGSHRIVCPGSQIAMPEVKIGYFPDVGASYFLNKCPGFTGMYLALTGLTIGPEDAIYAGLVTHYVNQENYPAVLKSLQETSPQTCLEVDDILKKFQEKISSPSLKKLQADIDRLFGRESLKEILRALEKEKTDFSRNCLQELSFKCPLSLMVTFELLKKMRGKSLKECLEYDFLLSQKFVQESDFFEGIRSIIIDKDQRASWQIKSLDEVSQISVEKYFDQHLCQKLFD